MEGSSIPDFKSLNTNNVLKKKGVRMLFQKKKKKKTKTWSPYVESREEQAVFLTPPTHPTRNSFLPNPSRKPHGTAHRITHYLALDSFPVSTNTQVTEMSMSLVHGVVSINSMFMRFTCINVLDIPLCSLLHHIPLCKYPAIFLRAGAWLVLS